MRSSELARLAHVTVRTLRHYHQMGLLAEPARTAGGYREYDIHDLIRVLRIRRLASLGLPLQNVPQLLEDETGPRGPLLDELDRELAAEIDRLTAQRALVAALRAAEAAPDVPPELARHARMFEINALSPAVARFDRDQLILLGHLAGEQGMSQLVGFYDRLAEPAVLRVAVGINQRFLALSDDSAEPEVTTLIDDAVEAFAPLVRVVTAEGFDFGDAARLLGDYTDDVLNRTQRRVLAQLEARLAAVAG